MNTMRRTEGNTPFFVRQMGPLRNRRGSDDSPPLSVVNPNTSWQT